MAKACLCSVSGCSNSAYGRGYCMKHYYRFRRTGDAKGLRRTPPQSAPLICEAPDCDKPGYAKGCCLTHYHRLYRHGSVEERGTPRGEPLDWMRRHINFNEDRCLTWPYAGTSFGKPSVWLDGRMRTAANAMTRLAHGAPPTALHEAAHSCGKGHESCVNPSHLRWATRSENHADKIEHGTHSRGERSATAKLTAEAVLEIRKLHGRVSGAVLAQRFGVTRGMISRIHRRRAWAWLE